MSDAIDLDARVAALLEPVPGANPAGRCVQEEYGAIDEARREENAALPQGIWVHKLKMADWALTERLCTDALIMRSKDLRIASMLCDAWVRIHGFAGAAPGFALIDGLCTRYWDGLFPEAAKGDLDQRVSVIQWLNKRLPIALRQVPIVIDATNPDRRFDWSDYVSAQLLEKARAINPVASSRSSAASGTTLATIQACAERTNETFFDAMLDDLARATTMLEQLGTTLDTLCGRDSPSLGQIRAVVTDVGDFAAAALAPRRRATPTPVAPAAADHDHRSAAMPMPTLAHTAPTSRAEAYRQLSAIARFLHATDPHSPTAYVLDRLVDWGRMTIFELDAELRNNGGGIAHLLDILGIDLTVEDDGSNTQD